MIIFQNPGLIELDAVTIMGLSAKLPNSFGRFGTGIKYGVATVLRGDGSIVIYRGKTRHEFTTRAKTVRDQDFNIVQLDGVDMGITTQLGRDWEPWMVLREFGCNAKDEDGDFRQADAADLVAIGAGLIGSDDMTTIVIDWPALDEAYKQRAQLFLEGEPLYADAKIRILSGSSSHLFYRGIRAYKLEKPSALTYDILEEQMLTEDRTLLSSYMAMHIAARALLYIPDQTAASAAICCGENYAEHKFDFQNAWSYGKSPSRQFLDAAIEARSREDRNLNPTARKVLLRQMRETEREGSSSGGFKMIVHDNLSYVVDALISLGIIDENSKTEVPIVPVDELPGETRSMVENGRIYILQSLLDTNVIDMAKELMARFIELRCPYGDMESVIRLVGPLLIRQHEGLARAQRHIDEEAKAAELCDAIDMHMEPMVIAADDHADDIPF